MIENLIKDLQSRFGESNIKVYDGSKQDTLTIDLSVLLELCHYLRDNELYYFDFLANITAVDYHPDNRFALVYNLASLVYQTQLSLRVELSVENRDKDNLPEVPSISRIWRTADWHEREAFDLMGIYFTGHSDLRRILLPDDWEGFPLRKDYEDADSYHGIPIKGE
ncbi:NADH-quinone oxidoreductase subunit C [Sphingobacterium bovistauri]|uniref:NADH-quinone oxidoreductase subunit C n=1 Tax=Sphingobacterium bovistauri TaxID=2781959 RepID=A0ABS7Z2E6_9SPHI|nr:NADH-quinone oxidoreductase subunit C [Sphingobacterium bovistauri]MCA5003782.1 NADH-quinone oxidoreductase subunit C [Sphingobacterium bovistauri]